MFVATAQTLGPLALAVHNAGSNIPGPFLELSVERFERHWREHALGGFNVAQAALPALLEVAGDRQRTDLARLSAAAAALQIDPPASRESEAVLSVIPALIRVLESGSFRQQGLAGETAGRYAGTPASESRDRNVRCVR